MQLLGSCKEDRSKLLSGGRWCDKEQQPQMGGAGQLGWTLVKGKGSASLGQECREARGPTLPLS